MSSELDLHDAVNAMTETELVELAIVLDVVGEPKYAPVLVAWSRWWWWHVTDALGEEDPGSCPRAVVLSQMSNLELEALRDVFIGMVANHTDDAALVTFCIKVVALAVAQLHNRATERVELADELAALRERRAREPYRTADDAGIEAPDGWVIQVPRPDGPDEV